MSDIVERLRGRADRYAQLWGNAYYYTDGDAALDKDAADTITALQAEVERLTKRMHRISLGSQNSSTTKEDLGRLARAALTQEKSDG